MATPLIDISEFQGDVDFAKVKADGIEGVIIRCGYSGQGAGKSQNKDSKFEVYYKGAKDAGLPVGTYYYSTAATEAEAVREADYALELIKGKEFAYPIFMDVEDPVNQGQITPVTLTQVVKTFLQRVEREDYFVGLYASLYWLENKLRMSSLSDFTVWAAQYASRLDYKGAYGMWQYSSSGRVDGINGNVDKDWAYIDYPSIIKGEMLNGFGHTAGNHITIFQNWLYQHYGFILNNDGIWGPITESCAVRAMQIQEGVSVDGIWGPKTQEACPLVSHGQSNAFVWILQGTLNKFGDSPDVDGIFGDDTLRAVKAFQKSAGLNADGIAGPATFSALFG